MSYFIDKRQTLLSTLNETDFKLLELTNYSLSQTLLYGYMATHYLIKKKKHSFLTQLLNIFYPLKDSKSLLFSKLSLESINPSRNFFKCFITFSILLSISFFDVFFKFIPGTLEFWCLVTVIFKFTVLYKVFKRYI